MHKAFLILQICQQKKCIQHHLKTGVNGYVKNTKPLVYQGNIIDDFTLTFENGAITKSRSSNW